MAENWWDSDKVADTGSDDFWAADAIASSTPPEEPGTLDKIGSYLSSALESVGQFGSDLASRAEANLPVLDAKTGKLGPKEKPINSVLTNAPMPEFNAAEANRMSRKSYVEEQDRMARSGQVMRATPEVKLTDAQRYAEANPIKASLKSGAATALAGTFNAPAVALQSVNEMVGNVGRGLGADIPVTRVPNMPLVDGLMKMGGEYTSQLQRRAPGEAWDNGEFGNWMLTQLGGNSMSMMQSLGALFVPGAQATLLSSMGAQAAGTSYAQGDSGISSALKGVVEAGSEMLPLKAAEKIKDVVGAIPLSARSGALEMAGRKLLAGGAAITTNSLVGAIEESVAQIGGNALDVLVDGQTKSLFDEVDRAAIVGAAANTTLAAPAILETMKGAGQGAPRSNFLADQAQQDAQDAWARYAVAPAVPASVQMAQQSQAAQADSDQAMQAISTASNVDDAIAAATQAVGSKQRAVNLDNDALLSQAMEQAEIAASELAMVPQAPIADPVEAVIGAPPSVIPQTEPVGATVWTGRRGDGYATEADAARAQAERTKTRPMFDWTIQPNAEGRYVLAGVKRDTQEALPEPLPALPAEVMAEESPGVAGRKLEESPASWVIRNKATREVVMETTQRSVAEKVNTDKYEALPVQDPLASLSESPATVLAPAVSEDAPQQPVRLGRNQQSLAEGGKPFATRTAAAEAKKSQPTMRVVKVDGGFALADKTQAQLAAEQKTALRLSQPNTSQSGEPIPAHAAIAAAGGLQKLLASDLGVEGNPRIGNRTLYAGKGRGLTIEQATEQLIEQGYLNEGASHNDAYALIKRSLTQPQYNADGIERIAEAEFNAEFDDYLTAQQEAAEQPDFDPFADGMADGYIEDDFDSSGYTPADDQIRAEVMALIAQADAMGIDSEMLIDDAVRATTEQTEQEYYEFARNNLQQALAESSGGSRDPAPNQDGAEQQRQEAERPGRADSGQDDGAEGFALDQQTPEQARREQEEAAAASRKEKAAKEAADLRALQEELRKDIAQRAEAAADSFELGGDALDNLSGQGAMFSRAAAAEVRNLVTLHNLSEENLLYADSIGGIPAPSIGITKVDSPFGGFGGITLIAPKGMIDPATGVPVFDRDAWTARFPEMNFKKVKAKVADAFYDRMKPMRDLPGGDGGFVAQMWEAIKNANTQSPDKVMQLFLRYEAARVMYAREVLGKEIKVPMRPVRALTIVGHEKGLQKYWALNKDAYLAAERSMSSTDFSKSQENIALSKQVELAAARIAESKDKPDLAAGFVSMMLTDGVLPVRTIGHLLRDFQSYGKTEVDAVKSGEAISKIVKRDDPGYLKWAQSLVQPLFEAPTITVRGREVEATLTNIVEAMTFGATEGVEKSMTYSPGKVAAVLGKKFKTLAEIQAARDQVVSQQSESEGKKATDALLEEYRTHVSQFYTGKDWRGQIDTWAANDASMEALAKAGKMTTSDGNVRISLQRMGFKDVDAKSLTLARQTIEALRNASTDYFEAKPQRAVKINEFRGAVVPKGTSPEALAILEKNGLTVEVHGKTEGAREKAVLKLANRLDKAAKDIRFSIDPSATMRAPSPPNQRQDAKAVQRVQSVVDAISEKWQNKPKVEIARSMQDPIIPKRVRDYDAELMKRGAEGDARGFIYGGKVYLVADQLRTDADIAETVFHEVLGHYGLRGAFGEALTPVLREVGDLRRKDVVAKAVSYRLLDKKKLSVPVDKATDKQIWAAMTPAHRREAAEELLAELAQSRPEIGFVKRAVAAIRTWLRANVPAFNRLKLSDSEIIQKFLLPARGFVERGGSMAGNNQTAFSRTAGDQTQTEAFKKWFKDSAVVDADGKPLVMYHGTSSNQDGEAFTLFDTFASNYGLMGMGAYFTADPAVASSYTTKGKGATPTVYSVYLSIQNPLDMDASADSAQWTAQFPEAKSYHEGGATNESWYRAAEDSLAADGLPKWEGAEVMQDGLRAMGFDGITHVGGGRVKADGIKHRVYIAFDPEQVKSATGNNGQFDRANPDIRFSFAGQNAATADPHALASAQERLGAGEDAEVVRRDTGWHKGADGKWRFEISDDRAFLKGVGTFGEIVMARLKALSGEGGDGRAQGGPVRLGDILRHPALFAAYPGLKQIEVEFMPKGRTARGSLGSDGVIQIQEALPAKEALSVLLHEVQHGIQAIEGFATGGPSGASMWVGNFRPLALAEYKKLVSELNQPMSAAQYAQQAWGSADVTAEIRRDYEGNYLASHASALKTKGLDKDVQATAGWRAYKRLAGEVEARNTQARQGMTAAERLAKSPEATADVPASDVIVTFNGKEMQSAPAPENAGQATPREFQPLANQSSAKALNDTLVKYGLGQDWSNAYEAVKLPDALSGIRDALQAAFGRNVRSVAPTAARFNIFNGVYIPSRPGDVYVNVAADVGFVNIAGHELWHAIKRQRPGLIEWYRTHSRQYYKDLPAYRDRLNALVQDGEKEYSTLAAEEELEADFMGDSLADPAFLQQLADASPSRFRVLLDQVQRWLAGVANKLKGLGSSKEVTDVQALQKYLKEVLVAFAEGKDLPGAPADIAPRYSRDKNIDMIEKKAPEQQGDSQQSALTGNAVIDAGIRFVSQVEALAEKHGRVYVRWSPSAENDLKGKQESRDFVSGEVHGGLSAIEIADDVHPVDIADRLAEYGFLRMQDRRSMPHVYLAKSVGVDSDGYSSVKPSKLLLDSTLDVVKAIDSGLADAMNAIDDIERENLRLKRSPGHPASLERLANAKARLASLAPADIAASEDIDDPRFSRTTGRATPRQGNRFLLPGENGARALRRKTQDYFIRMRDVQDAVVKQGGFIDESTNVYDAEVLSHGRANAQLQDFAFDQVEPLMKKLVKMGVEMDEFSLYAYAKHAEERNNQIAKIDPNTPDGGSGMTKAEADSILQLVALSGDQAKFDELHADLMAITQTNRLVMLDEGLITQEEYDALDGMYENYIPLRGFEVVDEDNKPTGRGAGKGFNIRGKETVRALGRKSRAGQLVENVIIDYQRTVVRAERNQVAKVFLNFVLNNQDDKLWEIDATTTRKSLQRQTGLVARSTTVDKGEDTIAVKVRGREIYIKINDPLLLRAMRKSHTDETGEMARDIMRTAGLYTSLLRNTLTRYNPEFALVNAARDFGFGSVAMLDALGEKGVAKFTAHYAGATMASVRSERRTGDPVNREWDKWFEEYRAVGGITGGFYQKGVEEITGDIRSMMVEAGAKPKDWTEKVRYNKATSLAKSALRVLEFAGSVSENAARVSAYRTAREMGKTRAEAALLAKGLTTNFDRKGEYGQMINSLYVFYNAAVQGAHKTLQMLANPKVQSYMVGLSSASVALAFANAVAGGDDPDDGMAYWDKIPDYIKERNLIIMLPAGIQVEGAEEVGTKGRYLMLPMQYGLNIPHVIGYGIADHIRNMQDKTRGITLKEAGLRIASAVAGSFNPFDGSIDLTNPSSMAQAVTPSIFDPVVQMATGTNSFGRDVAPFKSPFDSKPDSYNSNVRQAGSPAEKIAQWLNSATGGSSYESGGIDVSPGTIENMVRNMTGGTGMFIYDVVSLSANAIERATGNDPDLFIREIPLLRKGYGETAGDVDQGLFYDRRKKIEEARAVERGAEEEGVEITDPAKNALASMAKDTGKYSKWLSDIRKEMKEIQSDKEMARGDKKLKLRELRAERDRLTADFNKDFGEVMREAYAETPD